MSATGERIENAAEHTPGPWNIRYRAMNPEIPQNIVAPTGTVVTFMEQSSFRGDERRSNARLIASAPALLAALEAIVDYVAVNEMTVSPSVPVAPMRMKQIATAAIALALAKGK